MYDGTDIILVSRSTCKNRIPKITAIDKISRYFYWNKEFIIYKFKQLNIYLCLQKIFNSLNWIVVFELYWENNDEMADIKCIYVPSSLFLYL